MRVAYTGHEALTFTDYIDMEAGRTLHAEPGGMYDIAPASGRVVPEIPEPWFVLVAPEAPARSVPEPEPAPPGPDEAQDDPEPLEPSQF